MSYLFAHFTGEQLDGEQIYFSVSRNGLFWTDLNDGKPALRSCIGTKGVRDPFLVRHPDTGRCYLIATDLRIASGVTWQQAKAEASRNIIIWESDDLLHWDGPRTCTVGAEGTGCVWAPEAIFDREKQQFFVFFSSYVHKLDKLRIYGTWTKDFHTFSLPFIYFEKAESVIDTTLIEAKGKFYRISKSDTYKRLELEESDSLYHSFRPVFSQALADLSGVEGPEIYPLPNGSYCLIADQYASQKGYLPLITDDLSTGNFCIPPISQYHFGITRKRHGGIMEISAQEYQSLIQFYQQAQEKRS
ncbi:MAG: glycoside hydrolase family 43 protein [Clostridia bacterium]|nr:glycoside hydrolase family 43 protein [Clostridia bacterium]